MNRIENELKNPTSEASSTATTPSGAAFASFLQSPLSQPVNTEVSASMIPGKQIISAAVATVRPATASLLTSLPDTSSSTSSTTADTRLTDLTGDSTSSTSTTLANYNSEMAGMLDSQKQMLSLQIAMQRENQIFTTVSNVLKTRHDTAKNAISNIR